MLKGKGGGGGAFGGGGGDGTVDPDCVCLQSLAKCPIRFTQVKCCFVYRAIMGKMAVQFTIKTVNPIEACLYRLHRLYGQNWGWLWGFSVCTWYSQCLRD